MSDDVGSRQATPHMQRLLEEQEPGVPKERSRTYYYNDGLYQRKQMWVTHTPGMDIPMRVNKIWKPGIFEDEEYSDSLQMNIGTEKDAYKLYRALEAYFNDVRSPPWFAGDQE